MSDGGTVIPQPDRNERGSSLLHDVRQKLVLAVQRTPHSLPDGLSLVDIARLTGDEAHAPDCPGCAVTQALVLIQEAIGDEDDAEFYAGTSRIAQRRSADSEAIPDEEFWGPRP